MKTPSINWKGPWPSAASTTPSKVDMGSGTCWGTRSLTSFRTPDVQQILIDKLGLSVVCLCKEEGFVLSGNLPLGLPFKFVLKKNCHRKSDKQNSRISDILSNLQREQACVLQRPNPGFLQSRGMLTSFGRGLGIHASAHDSG